MKIGIDAKWYFNGPASGRTVVRNLVDSFLTMDDRNKYVIFLNKKDRREAFWFIEKSNVEVCYVWSGNNALSNIFVLPFYSWRYKVDALLYQTFISPFDRAKRIAYIHDVLFLSHPEFYTIIERIYFCPLKLLTRFASKIITVSNEEKARLLRFGFATKETDVIVAYHGVNENFQPVASHNLTSVLEAKKKYSLPDKFILFVGRLNLRKNLEHLLKALPLMEDKKIPLVIVGAEEWKKSNHRQIVEELNISDRIQFTGPIYFDLPLVYSLATVFCFPSYAESFGLPPLEAMASAVPVVVSHSTSLPEVCGEAATYVDPDRPDEIAEAIDKLLSNGQFYDEKRRLGLERAKTFTWNSAARTILDCFLSCFETAKY